MTVPPRWVEDLIAELGLPAGYGATISNVYGPLAAAIERRIPGQPRPFVVGINGPQGSGKSTGAEVLGKLLHDRGLSAAILSIDDLYLSHAERQRLAREVHPLLAVRGPPGTHDPGLGVELIDRLGRSGAVTLPRFDKGADDLRVRADWPQVMAPLDVLVFEGWCVGAMAQPAAALDRPVNRLEAEEDPEGVWRRYVNQALAGAYHALFRRIDLLVMLRAPDFASVLDWRTGQEHRLREREGPSAGMDDAGVARFIQLYERLTRYMAEEMPGRADVLVRLDAARNAAAPVFR